MNEFPSDLIISWQRAVAIEHKYQDKFENSNAIFTNKSYKHAAIIIFMFNQSFIASIM